MPDTNSHEFQIVAAARLCFKGENDRDWELLGISMGEEPSHNNVLHVVLNAQGINCEQHDNKDLVDSAGDRTHDLLIWRASFDHACFKDIRVKEIETPGKPATALQLQNKVEPHATVTIVLEFTYSGSPRGEEEIKLKGTKRLQQSQSTAPGTATGESSKATASSIATVEPTQKSSVASSQDRHDPLFAKAEDFPLEKLCAQTGPLQIRLESRRLYQGILKKRSARVWHWGAVFALLAGRSDYKWSLSKLASNTWMDKSLTQWVQGQWRQWEAYALVKEGDDGWYQVIPKERADVATLPIIPAKRDADDVAEIEEQGAKRQKPPLSKSAQLRKELHEELRTIGAERKASEEKYRVRESLVLDRLLELDNEEAAEE